METNNISRLREEQQKAISETEEKMGQLEKFKADYEALQKRLETLPDKVTHEVMVPFGKLAFMPGQLVHTNEILVLLGDNWFAERSAKQAQDIAGRRITELDKRIAELKEQKKLLDPRLGLTSELQAVSEGKGDYKEIVEEYDEEKEKLWDEQHKINVRHHHEQMRKLKNQTKPEDDDTSEKRVASRGDKSRDEELWSRLDALEKLEEERGELNSSFESEGDAEDHSGKTNEGGHHHEKRLPSQPRDKRVNWVDEQRDKDGRHDDDDSDDDSDDEDDGYDNDGDDSDNGDQRKPVIKTITFQHTKTLPPEERGKSRSSHDDDSTSATTTTTNSITVTSPGEIYKLFSPKPILKKTPATEITKATTDHQHHRTVRFPDEKGDNSPLLQTCNLEDDDSSVAMHGKMSSNPKEETSKEKAFSGIVRETPTTPALPQSIPAPIPAPSNKQERPKRVSKFKAQRMGQNP